MTKETNFTPRLKKVLKESEALATGNIVGSLHLLISSLEVKQAQIEQLLLDCEINSSLLAGVARDYLKKCKLKKQSKLTFTKDHREALSLAKALADQLLHEYVGIEHLFLALLKSQDPFLNNFYTQIQFPTKSVSDRLISSLKNNDLELQSVPALSGPQSFAQPKAFLSQFSINLNSQVLNGKIGKLHIDKDLISKISEILCRKNKCNPLLIGEAGVGKSALVEALAQAIVFGQISDFLAGKQIHLLDTSLMIAGCKLRGQFEERLKGVLKEAIEDHNVILFIDEIHTIIGAGNNEGGLDLANIIKPYLARGELCCIGATTFDEYKTTIATDPALTRRFQILKIEEPDKEQVKRLISNSMESFEEFHYFSCEEDVLDFLIEVSDKHIEGRFPDKAFDLLDQAGSKVKLRLFEKTEKMKLAEKKMEKSFLENPSKGDALSPEQEKILQTYQKEALKLIVKLKTKKYKLTKDDILQVVADKTGVALDQLNRTDAEKLNTIKKSLENQVVGQDNAIERIYKTLLRSKAGLNSPSRPIASLLFVGPSGVGKTFLAKKMAENLFLKGRNHFVSLDMSEYSDGSAVAKLVGSATGYIGHEKGGVLTEAVKRVAHSVILFDGIQNADPSVHNLLLQILEQGKLTDSFGKVANFTNTVIIVTTDVGCENLSGSSPKIGFGPPSAVEGGDSEVMAGLKKHFQVDFLNRIDDVLVLRPLDEKSLRLIIKKDLNNLKDIAESQGIGLTYDDKVVQFVFSKIDSAKFGARQIKKTIQREIESTLAEKMLENEKCEKNLEINVEDNNISVRYITDQQKN
jgi:ATP-dependent Clp protease ATP-binding subunit ClpC